MRTKKGTNKNRGKKDTEVFVTVSGVDKLVGMLRSVTSEADQMIQKKMLDSVDVHIVSVAKSLAPRRTGELQGSISAEPGDLPMQVLLKATKAYSAFLELGTRPHLIQPVNRKALHWEKGGASYFAKSVNNPGIPEGKFAFIHPAIDIGRDQLIEDLRNLFSGMLVV